MIRCLPGSDVSHGESTAFLDELSSGLSCTRIGREYNVKELLMKILPQKNLGHLLSLGNYDPLLTNSLFQLTPQNTTS